MFSFSDQGLVLASLLLFGILNAVDIWVTRVVLTHGGKERNPVMNFLYRKLGFTGMILLKLLILIWLGFQFSVGGLDLFTITYLNLIFIFVIGAMIREIKKAGVGQNLNPLRK